MNNNLLFSFLKQLGSTSEEAMLFEVLCKRGVMTILELSRVTKINRTSVYRLVEKLKEKGLVEEVVEEHRLLVKAADIHQLSLLIKEQEAKAKMLKDALPQLSSLLSSSIEASQPGTRVLFYRGEEGIKQMVWNVLKAKNECVGYTYRRIEEVVGEKFNLEWRQEFVERGLRFRDVYSDEYFKSLETVRKITKPEWETYFNGRYISKSILNINHQVDIYNNVVGIYNWHEGEVFGVEIYNEKVATMQKQLFEIVWKLAKSTR